MSRPFSRKPRQAAFTLIELLVVVAIIALLISILLPSLTCAREKARAAKCGVQLRSLGSGLAAYFSENNDWIPGVNTTGVAIIKDGSVGNLRKPSTPVQSFDWFSSVLRYETEMGENRAERWRMITNEYHCPSLAGMKIDEPYAEPSPPPDIADFTGDFVPLSYLMPVFFQLWGGAHDGYVVGLTAGGRNITAKVAPDFYSLRHAGKYTSRKDKVGLPAEKVMAADATRFLDETGILDFDIKTAPDWFGSFTCNSAWWAGSQAFGVKTGTLNWDGTPTTRGPNSEGKNMLLSYRHGCGSASETQDVRGNKGAINAMFFDGHVKRLEDRASRNPDIWYPRGSTPPLGGPTNGLIDLPDDYEVP